MKKLLTAIISITLMLTCFSACNKDEAAVDDSGYNGILTKIKLGMPVSIVLAKQPETLKLNYESDTVLWGVNPDTDLMEIRDLIPAESAYYYIDDSIITYSFETQKGNAEMTLSSYMSEVHGVLDRTMAEDYFKSKGEALQAKHGVEFTEVQTGTEDVDMELNRIKRYSCASYDVIFTLTEKFDTVDGVEGYYGSAFSIEVKSKPKEEVAVSGDSKAKE